MDESVLDMLNAFLEDESALDLLCSLIGGLVCTVLPILLIGSRVYFGFRKMAMHTKKFMDVAERLGLHYWHMDEAIPGQYAFLDRIARVGEAGALRLVEGEYRGHFVRVFECIQENAKRYHPFTVFILEQDRDFPELHFTPKTGAAAYEPDDTSPDVVSDLTYPVNVRCAEPEFAQIVCNSRMMEFFRGHEDLHVEIERNCVALLFSKALPASEWEPRLNQLVEIAEHIPGELPNPEWMKAPEEAPLVPERWQTFEELGERFGLDHRTWDPVDDNKYMYLEYVRWATNRRAFTVLEGMRDNRPLRILDFHDPGAPALNPKDFTYFVFDVERDLPGLQVYRSGMTFRSTSGGMVEISVGGDSVDMDVESVEFSKTFVVRSSSKRFAYDFCHPRMMALLLANPDLHIEINKNYVAFGFLGTMDPGQLQDRFRVLEEIQSLFPDYLVSNDTDVPVFDDKPKPVRKGCLSSLRMPTSPLGCVLGCFLVPFLLGFALQALFWCFVAGVFLGHGIYERIWVY